jgi:hypothetical protein
MQYHTRDNNLIGGEQPPVPSPYFPIGSCLASLFSPPGQLLLKGGGDVCRVVAEAEAAAAATPVTMIILARVRVRASQSNELCGQSPQVTLPGFSGVFLELFLTTGPVPVPPLPSHIIFGSLGIALTQGHYIQVEAACCVPVVALDFLDLLG